MTKATYAGISLAGDNPPNICQGCAQNGIEHLPSGAVFVYCSHNRTGTFRRSNGAWVVREYIDVAEFKRAISFAVLRFEKASDDLTVGMTRQ